MLSGISLLCFTASYAVALALEVTRLMFRSGIRGAVMLLFAGAGFVAHTLYLVAQAVETAPMALPLSNWYHWYLLAAWLLALVYLYLTFYHPRNPIGLFLLPLVLLLIAAAYYVRNDASPPATQARAVWLWVHVLGFLLGTVTVFIGFATGVMYLAQSWRLKNKLPASSRLKLPSLEWLQTATARSLVVSMLLVSVGVVGGLVRNYHLLRTSAGGLRWSDPTIWSSAVLLGWLVASVGFNALYRPSREGRKVAYLTVASFGFLVLTLAVTLLIPAAHTKVGWREEAGGWKLVNVECRSPHDERMTNDEARMVGWPEKPVRHSDFGLHSSFVIRHLSFVDASPPLPVSVLKIGTPTSDLRPPTSWRLP